VALLLGMAMAPLAGAQQAFPPPEPTYSTAPGPVPLGANPAAVELKVRRVRDAVEVVIENTGTAPQLEQSTAGGSWLGRLYTTRPSVLLRGPQAVAVPDAGFERISIEGGGTVYNLRVTPVPGYPVRPPLVSADGRNVVLSFAAPAMPSQQTMRRNSLAPGAVANPVFAPPLRQRASAPPLGDMAVGTMVLKDPSSSGELDVGGPTVTLTFRNVPALTALQALARIGGYGFIANAKNSTLETTDTRRANTAGGLREREISTKETRVASPPVTATFVREDFRTAFNLILTSAGLQAKFTPNRRTIVVGQDACGFGGGRIASKVYRLNQASPESAAHYLASLGSFIRIPRAFQTTQSIGTATNVGAGSSSGGQTSSNTTSTITRGTEIEAFGGQLGPLQGLCGTIDKRLGTITLVGQPSLVSVGEQYLKQIDLRQRQVALSIRILDVTLDNETEIDNSFAFRYGNNFIVNQQGQLVANFGALKPPSSEEGGLPGLFDGATGSPIVGAGAFKFPGVQGEPFINLVPPTSPTPFFDPNNRYRPSFGSYNNPGQPAVTGFTRGTPAVPAVPDRIIRLPDGSFQFIQGTPAEPATPDTITSGNPAAFQYPRNQFFDFVRAQITSGSTKVLASPTLILSENSEEINSQGGSSGSFSEDNFLGGISTNNLVTSIGRPRANESAVVVGERIITGYEVQAGQNGATNSCQPEFGIAGLTFGARVSKIDDNGFVTFSISPTISAAGRQEFIQGCGNIALLTLRSLDTGSARVRDGQTLILTGVISDRDLQLATKWPVLGDLPVVGQFFRNSTNGRQKRELVVMVTPRIINDTEGGTYGYGYEPSTRDTRQFMTPSLSTPMPSAFPQR
jgi:type IV pilus assembly protein PilQ